MTLYRFFMLGFLFVTCIACAGTPLFAQTNIANDDIWIRENANIKIRVSVPTAQGGCMTEYSVNDDCPDHHQTSKGNPLEHIHVHYAFPVLGIVVRSDDPNITVGSQKEITDDNVRAYWDWWYAIEAKRRENVESFHNDKGESATYNCWAYAFGYNIWIQDPDPIYNDSYVSTNNPSEGDVIRKSGHVIPIKSINYCESPYLVIVTREKNRYSGIYHFVYEYSLGLGGDDYKDYYTPK